MINEKYAKKFCCEDNSLIQNYDLAIADMTQTWECHHRGELLPCGRFSRADLKRFELYYNRTAAELIFLTPSAHRQLHLKGIPKNEECRAKLSKKILQLTKVGEFIREWPSLSEASRQLKVSLSYICSCCNGIRKSAGGYVWKYV